MLWIIGAVLLIVGAVIIRSGNKKHGEGASRGLERKIGLALVFLGIVCLAFIIALNILFHTGRLPLTG